MNGVSCGAGQRHATLRAVIDASLSSVVVTLGEAGFPEFAVCSTSFSTIMRLRFCNSVTGSFASHLPGEVTACHYEVVMHIPLDDVLTQGTLCAQDVPIGNLQEPFMSARGCLWQTSEQILSAAARMLSIRRCPSHAFRTGRFRHYVC